MTRDERIEAMLRTQTEQNKTLIEFLTRPQKPSALAYGSLIIAILSVIATIYIASTNFSRKDTEERIAEKVLIQTMKQSIDTLMEDKNKRDSEQPGDGEQVDRIENPKQRGKRKPVVFNHNGQGYADSIANLLPIPKGKT